MKQFLRGLASKASLLCTALLILAAAPVLAQRQPTATPPEGGFTFTPWTNALPALGNHTNTSMRGDSIGVPARTIMTVGVTVTGGNIGTSNVVCRFNAQNKDGFWTTDFPYTLTLPSNGTNVYRVIRPVGTNILARFLRLDQMESTSTNSFTFTNWTYTFFPAP